jgi:hypothetical protein
MRRDAFAAVACVSLGLTGCGLDLKGEAGAESDAGDNPAQIAKTDAAARDEGGVVDATSSPEASTPDANVAEANDTTSHPVLDAGEDEGADTSAPTDAPVADTWTPPEASSTCNFSGTWGVKITIPVNWTPQGITSVFIAPGNGTIEQWVKSTRVQTGNTTAETAVVCGIKLPDFSGTNFVGGETYGVRFPDTLFDAINPDGGWRSRLQPFTTTGTLSDSTPNATYTTTASAALIGLTLPNATTATWPATITTAVDSDQDGNPGVTIAMATGPDNNGGVYSNVPVDLSATRANELYVVIRQVTSLSGAASDCDHMSGTASIPKIPATPTGKYAIDSHIIGCGLVAGGNCSPAQAGFADGTQPVFSPSGTSVFASARVPSDATCANIRQLLP